MSGRYSGAYMKAHKLLPGAKSLSHILDISQDAKKRLKWLDWYKAHGKNARLTCRHFNISPDTFYRWKERFKPGCVSSLESRSRRPTTFRKSAVPLDTVNLVVSLRKQDMALSKYKLSQILLSVHGVLLSASSIQRILVAKGLITQANVSRGLKRGKRLNRIIPRIRASKQMRYIAPGHLVQIDTKHLIIMGRKFYQFTAIDCYTRLGFSWAYTAGSSLSARDFLLRVKEYFPFIIQSIQTDNGSEYLMYFHAECKKQGIKHFFSHPQTPKDNAMAERFIQTTEYELWLFDKDLTADLAYINYKLTGWIGRYNTYRPHQSLNYLTPMEYYQKGGKVYGK
jgi:transposase InsO family protein